MPKALLINPWIHDFAAHDFWARPLGLLEVGSALRAAGYDISLIDCLDLFYPGRSHPLPRRRENGSGRFDQTEIPKPPALSWVPRKYKRYGMPTAAFAGLLHSLRPPEVVLVNSVMTYWYPGVAEAVAEVRKVFPRAPVIVGGVYASLLPEHAERHTGADLVAAGSYGACLPPLLRSLDLPADLPNRDFFPAWDLYARLMGAALLTGRGCSHRCPYCAVPLLHPRLSRREPEAVVSEIARLVRDFSVRDIAFFDDSLRAAGDDHLAAILEGVIKEGLVVRFHAINALHLRNFSPELARLLKRAGFSTLRFGLETADPERAAELGNKADIDDLHRTVACLQAAGYAPHEIGIYLLAGLPGQPPEEIAAGIQAVQAAGARPYLSEFSPVPGSRLWEKAVAASPLNLAAEPLFHNNTILPCASPELDFAELERLKWFSRTTLPAR